jgi:DNA polymerase I-like protein with 3'-5' exonuclease and polymerase domains
METIHLVGNAAKAKTLMLYDIPTDKEIKSNTYFQTNTAANSIANAVKCEYYDFWNMYFHPPAKYYEKLSLEEKMEYLQEFLQEHPQVKLVILHGVDLIKEFTRHSKPDKLIGSIWFNEELSVHVAFNHKYSYSFTKKLDNLDLFHFYRKFRAVLHDNFALPERNYPAYTDYSEAMEALQAIYEAKEPVSFDIEISRKTKGLYSFAFAGKDWSFCIPFYNVDFKLKKQAHIFTTREEGKLIQLAGKILEDPDIPIIGQNMMFDVLYMALKYHIYSANIHCTLVQSKILSHEHSNALDYLTAKYTYMPYYKDDGKEAMARENSDEVFWLYNATDTRVTYDIFYVQKSMIDKFKMTEVYDNQVALFGPLLYMSLRGMRVDVELKKKFYEDGEKEIRKLAGKFVDLIGTDINLNSSKQLATLFYDVLKMPKVQGAGDRSTDITAIKEWAKKGCKPAQVLKEYRAQKKLDSTYWDTTLSADNRFRCEWKPMGVKFGRLSSSKTIFGEGGNQQNQPHIFKKVLIPDDGYILFNMDLEQAENRIVAYLSNEQRLIEAFANGTDIHSLTAGNIFQMDYEQIIKEDKEGITCSIGDGVHTRRYWGKKANHGFNYVLGPYQFAVYYECTRAEGKRIRDVYFNLYPNIGRWHNHLEAEIVNKKQTLVSPFGRRFRFLDPVGALTKAASCVPQSIVPDIMYRQCMFPFFYNNDGAFKHLELLNQVHDSIVFQLPLSIGFGTIAGIVWDIKQSIEHPIEVNGWSVSIPTSIGFSIKNQKDTYELKSKNMPEHPDDLAQVIEENI